MRAARASRSYSRCSVSASWSTAQRENAPIAAPSSFSRPTESPFQNGTAPGTPGAGVTTTRSRPISSMRQLEAPSRKVCPARLVDHLLVELPHPPAVRERGRVQPAVGDRAGVGHRQLAGAPARPDRARQAVPHDPRPQLPELLGGVAPVEHVEHVLQQLTRELGVGVCALHQRVQLVDRHRAVRSGRGRRPSPGGVPCLAVGRGRQSGRLRRDRDRDDLLGEHVERVARHDRRLDQPLAHAPGHDRALEQVAAELGEDPPHAQLADAVAGAADALQAARDGLGGLDLQHEVDGAHVDPQLQRAGRHQTRQAPGLQQLLDLRALLTGERPVVGTGDLLSGLAGGVVAVLGGGELVQAQRHPLGGAAVVDEDDRRVVLAHLTQQLRVDRRPDRAFRALPSLQLGSAATGVVGARRRWPGRPSTPPGPRCAGPAACGSRRPRSSPRAGARRGSGRPPRAGSGSR